MVRLQVAVIDPGSEPPACADVLLEAAPGATLADVAGHLRRAVGCPEQGLGFRAGREPLAGTLPLGEPPLLRGAILVVDRPQPPGMPLTSEAVIHLDVVGGLGAGTVVPLGRGVHVVGRSGGCAVRLEDPAVSRHHLEVSVASTGITVRNLAATNGTTLSGIPLEGLATALRPGERLRVGSTTLIHRISALTPAATTLVDGIRRVHRPPRFASRVTAVKVEFPRRPTRPERSRLPLLAACVPLVLSMLLAVVLRSPVMMLFALLTPAMLLGQWWSDRRHGRASHRHRLAEHAKELREAERALEEALERERAQRHTEAPDLAVVARVVTGPDARLWERRPVDLDYLAVRVGVGPQQPRTVAAGEEANLPLLPLLDVPVVIRLGDVGVLGVAAPRGRALALSRSLVAQLCAWHSPRDVRLVVLSAEPDGRDDWGWAALLPHLAPLDQGCLAALGDLAEEGSVARRVAELATLVGGRREPGARSRPGPDFVVVLDGSEVLRREPGVAELLRDGPEVGVHFICLDRDATRLPVEAKAQVVLTSGRDAQARLDRADGGVPTLVPDLPTRAWAEALARACAPLEDATPLEDGPGLPGHVDFLDLHRSRDATGDPLDPAAVARRWSVPERCPVALLGEDQDGPVMIDLVQDGPHALVGGTTGAGKSELLQTLVASLAVHSPPDELAFVLIDYKGGSAFRSCAGLPHVLGIVTDLDEHLTARALTSLGAELKRRERLLATVGAKDLAEYRRRAGPARERLARLVLVVDEFKVLAEELPDFVTGLVRLAAVGRSLGVHLVLATQRPAGIISADMRANVGLRIALRVRDRSDSDDVIDSPEAARISDRLPGRGYLRTGSQRLMPVQVAHLGAAPEAHPKAALLPAARVIRWHDLMRPLPVSSATPAGAEGSSVLEQVAGSVTEAACLLGLAPPASPWLPPLPDLLAADDDRLRVDPDGDAVPGHSVPLGLVDRPTEQRQPVLLWDPLRDGHLGLGGAARTGRTTTVVAVALRLAERCSPRDLHLHAIEGAPGSLQCLAALPHCGSITAPDDAQRMRRAVLRLAESRQPAGRHTVVLIDGWEPVTEALDDLDQGESTERLLGLIRDGLSRGIHVLVAGGRTVASGRLGSLLQRRLLLDMPDPVDLTLAGLSPGVAKRRRPPGRAVDVSDEAEVQLALPGADRTADPVMLAKVVAASAADRWRPTPPESRPWRLLPLPERVPLEALPPAPNMLLVGVGGDDLEPLGFDLSRDERRILVVGPPRSGRSTVLQTMAAQLLSAGHRVAVIASSRSRLVDAPAWAAPAPAPAPAPAAGSADLHVFRVDECDRFVALRREHVDLAVLVDDVHLIEGTPLEAALVESTRLVEGAGGLMAVTLDSRRAAVAFRGLVPEVSRAGVGVILRPTTPSDGDLLRVRVEPQQAGNPGRGVLVTDGIPLPIQIATPPSSDAAPVRK